MVGLNKGTPIKLSIGRRELKYIAIFAMTINHIGYVFDVGSISPELFNLTILIGYITFPIMAYMITQGFIYTRSRFKYSLRLFIFSIISIVPFHLAFDMANNRPLNLLNNVFFTLFFGLLSLAVFEEARERIKDVKLRNFVSFCSVTLLYYLSQWSDWGLYGIPLIMSFYILRNSSKKILFPILGLFLFISIVMWSNYFVDTSVTIARPLTSLGILLTIPLLTLYDNKKHNTGWKYFFYFYYPAHLLILFLFRMVFK